MRPQHGNHKEGFTLVEIIVTLILVGIVSFVSIRFFAQYLQMALLTPITTRDVNYAQQEMERIYMDGRWLSGNDIPETGVARTWSAVNGTTNPVTNRVDYSVITVDVH